MGIHKGMGGALRKKKKKKSERYTNPYGETKEETAKRAEKYGETKEQMSERRRKLDIQGEKAKAEYRRKSRAMGIPE